MILEIDLFWVGVAMVAPFAILAAVAATYAVYCMLRDPGGRWVFGLVAVVVMAAAGCTVIADQHAKSQHAAPRGDGCECELKALCPCEMKGGCQCKAKP